MENYCIMVQTGSEEKFKEEATSRLSEIDLIQLWINTNYGTLQASRF